MKKKLLGAALLTILFVLSVCVYSKHGLFELLFRANSSIQL